MTVLCFVRPEPCVLSLSEDLGPLTRKSPLHTHIHTFSSPSLFAELITATLQSQSSLLFPVDASTRLMELLILLDQHWSYSIAQAHAQGRNWIFPLCIVSKTAKQMVDFARSLMEWMGGAVAEGETSMDYNQRRNGNEMRGHPLEFR